MWQLRPCLEMFHWNERSGSGGYHKSSRWILYERLCDPEECYVYVGSVSGCPYKKMCGWVFEEVSHSCWYRMATGGHQPGIPRWYNYLSSFLNYCLYKKFGPPHLSGIYDSQLWFVHPSLSDYTMRRPSLASLTNPDCLMVRGANLYILLLFPKKSHKMAKKTIRTLAGGDGRARQQIRQCR